MERRHGWHHAWLGIATALVLLLLSIRPVRADDYVCTGAVGAIGVDNVEVPAGATCTLTGTRVDGNIEVRSNATLYARGAEVEGSIQSQGGALISVDQNTHVNGNIQADNVAQVRVDPGTSVGGNIQIVSSGGAAITGVTIGSDLQFEANSQALVADSNIIDGNLQAFQNTGGLTITGNTIYENLQCKENAPPPIGWGNIVHGSLEDQCATFDAPAPGPTPEPTPDPTQPPPEPTPSEPPALLGNRVYLPAILRSLNP